MILGLVHCSSFLFSSRGLFQALHQKIGSGPSSPHPLLMDYEMMRDDRRAHAIMKGTNSRTRVTRRNTRKIRKKKYLEKHAEQTHEHQQQPKKTAATAAATIATITRRI